MPFSSYDPVIRAKNNRWVLRMFNFKKHRSMHQCIPNTRDYEIMLKIVLIDGIGLSCVVALEMSRTFLMP
jgi:hypothetical protein